MAKPEGPLDPHVASRAAILAEIADLDPDPMPATLKRVSRQGDSTPFLTCEQASKRNVQASLVSAGNRVHECVHVAAVSRIRLRGVEHQRRAVAQG